MKLILLLIVLITQKYVLPQNQIANKVLEGFQWYLGKINSALSSFDKLPSFVDAVIAVIPFVILGLILQLPSYSYFYGIIPLVITLFLLWICIDCNSAITTETDSKAKRYWVATEDLFAPMFWFLIFGITGVLIYYILKLYYHIAIKKVEPKPVTAKASKTQGQQVKQVSHEGEQAKSLRFVKAIIDWLPARLACLTFALAGNFLPVMKKLIGGLLKLESEQLVASCGEVSDDTEVDESFETDLVQRSVLLWLLVIALVTLGPLII